LGLGVVCIYVGLGIVGPGPFLIGHGLITLVLSYVLFCNREKGKS